MTTKTGFRLEEQNSPIPFTEIKFNDTPLSIKQLVNTAEAMRVKLEELGYQIELVGRDSASNSAIEI
jgi:hypothetical protein